MMTEMMMTPLTMEKAVTIHMMTLDLFLVFVLNFESTFK